MDPALRERIIEMRRVLKEIDDPEVGVIADPSTHATFPLEIPLPYQEFLREADGMACGVALLYEGDDILKQQGPAKLLPGSRTRWFCFGSLNENPLMIDRWMNAVYCFDAEAGFDSDDALGDVDYFLLTTVFGDGYAEFTPNPLDDRWLPLLQERQ